MGLKEFFGIEPLSKERLEVDIHKMQNHLGSNGIKIVKDFYTANDITYGHELTLQQALSLNGELTAEMSACCCLKCI
jgi:hypothetical protein